MPEKPLIPVTPAADAKTKAAEPQGGAAADSAAKVKRLDGVTSIDDKVFLECEMLAHSAVSDIAHQIAAEAVAAMPAVEPVAAMPAQTAKDRTVILLDEPLVSAFQLFSALKLQLALFEKGFDGVAPLAATAPPEGLRLAGIPGMAISTVTGAVEGVLDLLGLFRQDTQYSGRAVAIKETALYLEVAHFLRQKGFQVIYPRLLTFQAEEETQLSQTDMSQLFDGEFTARQKAAQRLRPMLVQVAGIEQEILDREREFPSATTDRQKVLTQEIQDRKARLVTARKNLDPDLVLFENTDTQWNDLQKGLATPDEKSGQVPMQLLNRAAEAIARFRTSAPAYFLYADAVVAGGTMRTKRNLWRTLFHGDAIEFSGGAVISYALFDGKARILAARTHRFMTEFRGFPDETPAWGNFNSFES
jgi:hypothetical protein